MDRIFHFNLFTELIARLQPQNQDSGSRKVPAPPVGGWRPAVLEVEEKGDQVGQRRGFITCSRPSGVSDAPELRIHSMPAPEAMRKIWNASASL
ncbi:MAG: hypothetical protein DMG08_14930, partial [Acidobacteria bacterium]